MRAFLQALLENGHVSVPLVLNPVEKEDPTSVILEFDRAARLNLPGTAPSLDLTVAGWAATLLFRGCQLLVLRNLDAAAIREALQLPCPATRSPATDYSADLFLRYLPDLHAIARRLATDDPLVAQLEFLAAQWPLSSVALEAITPGPLDSFLPDPSLRQLYADRIIAHKALRRAFVPEIADTIRSSYGAFPELCPDLDAILALPPAT